MKQFGLQNMEDGAATIFYPDVLEALAGKKEATKTMIGDKKTSHRDEISL